MAGTVYPIRVTIPEARTLADLYGIANDLEVAGERCQRALEIAKASRRDARLVEALVEAALIRYFRCFKLSKARAALNRGDIEPSFFQDHNFFENLRDKFVAHSENPFEDTCVTAVAHKQDDVCFPIQSLGLSDHRVVLDAEHAAALAMLISHVRSVVKAKMECENSQVLKAIQRIPLEQLYSGDMPLPLQISDGDVAINRKRGPVSE